MLVSTAIALGAVAVVSAGRAFADVPGIAHVVPDEEGVVSLLARSA